uniref:Attractin n=1 Tax=Timema cristinae TaxID=61476 RepID=A0A7R9CD16_TIMCR|nr:unnamed protein product [Timema cristinae]
MWRLLLLAFASLLVSGVLCTWDCDRVQCEHGTCSPEEGCLCEEGWQGDKCQFCGGKVRLSESPGVITSGPGVHPPNTTCSWILDAFHKGRNGRPVTNQPVIRLFVERFTAECGGSYRLYVHDGDNVDAPLLAMLSGVMYDQDYKIRRLPEIVARSGYAFLHLRSDSSVDMSDLRISYKMGGCPSLFPNRECSDNGECMNDECACDILYNGTACDTPLCPNNCAYPNGKCDRLVKVCKCGAGFKGEDCSQRSDQGFWEMVTPRDSPPLGLASHQAVIWGDLMYVLGGESYSGGGMLQEFNIRNNVWKAVYVREYQTPELRYGHSAVLHGDEVFMYGGVLAGGEVSGELWAYDINAKMWENITVNSNQCYVMCGEKR